MAECVICGATITLGQDSLKGELVECPDCGTELEIVGTDPIKLAEAPTVEEDWGE